MSLLISRKFASRVGLVVLLAAAGCQEQKKAKLSPPDNEIARVGNASISDEVFDQLLRLRSEGDPGRFQNLSARAALLDELIRREATYSKAIAAGFDQRPDIQESIKQLITSKFQEEQLAGQSAGDRVIPQALIDDYYRQHPDQFTVPAAVRGETIFIKVPSQADREKRELLMASAQRILDQVKSASPSEFSLLVQLNSDDQATRYRGGDTGWVSDPAPASQLEPAVVKALLALKDPGDIAPLVPTKKGIYIVRLVEKRLATKRPLLQVKELIAYRLTKEREAQRENDFYANMEAGLDISINQRLLESISLSTPTRQAPSPLPGTIAQIK